MSLPDDHIEYLLEELIAGRLDPESEARVRHLVSQRPDLAKLLDEIRRDTGDIRFSLHLAGDDTRAFPNDTTLAMFLDGALDELDRATLEAELAGNPEAQQRLASLYREVVAAVHDEPVPDVSSGPSHTTSRVVPFKKKAFQARSLLKFSFGIVGTILVFIAMFLPPGTGLPTFFLGMASFSAWIVYRHRGFEFRPRRLVGLVPALVLFILGVVSGQWAVWFYVASAVVYWKWLLRASQGGTPVAAVEEPRESEGRRAGGRK